MSSFLYKYIAYAVDNRSRILHLQIYTVISKNTRLLPFIYFEMLLRKNLTFVIKIPSHAKMSVEKKRMLKSTIKKLG